MKNATTTLLCLLVAASGLANAEVEQRDLRDFTGIEVGGGIDVELRQDSSFAVEVDSGDVDADDILTDVRNGTLRIRRDYEDSDFGFLRDGYRHEPVLVRIALPVLEELHASGGSSVDAGGTFSGRRLELGTSGGSDVALTVDVDTLDIEASGGSELKLEGKARLVLARTSGGSDLKAEQLTATEAELRASGGSDSEITVVDSIIATASGTSDITYHGSPGFKDIDTSGSSDVHQRD